MSDEANDERMCECECVESMHNKLVIIFKQQLKTQKANTPFRWRQWPFSFQLSEPCVCVAFNFYNIMLTLHYAASPNKVFNSTKVIKFT